MDSGFSLLLQVFTQFMNLFSSWALVGGVSILCIYLAMILFSFVFNNIFKFIKGTRVQATRSYKHSYSTSSYSKEGRQ